MRIQHNIMAMNAYRNYTNNVSAMKANLEKLSSGYKINRAGDDAAGLAISEKMRAQITGLETAQKNAKDGISLVQTAEGALTEVHDMLNRMVELATQSANGTYDNETDRFQLQKEVDQLRSEINRIADSSNFNGIKLLDGSMDAEVGSLGQVQNFVIPPEGDNMQTETILHKGGTPATAKFALELHDYECATAQEGDTLTIKLGGQEFTAEVEAADIGNDGKLKMADVIAKAVNGKELNGVEIAATASGNKVNFTGAANTELDVDLHVESISIAPASGTYDVAAPVPAAGTAIGAAATSAVAAAGITTDLATTVASAAVVSITKNDLNAALNAAGIKLTADSSIAITKTDSGYSMTVNGKEIAHAAAPGSVAASGTGTITFQYDNAGTPATLGTVTFKLKTGKSLSADDAGAINLTVATSPTISAVKTGTTGTAATKDFKDALSSAAKTANKTGKVTVVAKGTTGVQVKIGDTVVTGVTAAVSAGNLKLTAGTQDYTITLDGLGAAGTAGDLAKMLGTNGSIDTNITISEPPETREMTGTFNEYTTENTNGVEDTAGRLASTTFELNEAACKEGSYIQIGAKKYTIAAGDANGVDGDTITVTKELLAEGGDKLVDTVGELLSNVTDNPDFTIGYKKETNRLSVHEKALADGEKHAFEDKKGAGYVEGGNLDTVKGFEKLLGFGTAAKKGRGLTLQIGDTADDYNKLTVNIKDMHTNAMGIADISIADQDSAATAVQKIKEAINYVSDVRGTLGATQNRLDHTINNLSVMTENIQDAESTIRDTDVAEEMMAYTKNNILIQSAQAMLAQANQVPQGVLQLLQ